MTELVEMAEFITIKITMSKEPAVYILASQRNGTLYIGVTSDLVQRIWEHKLSQADGFTKKYHMFIRLSITNITTIWIPPSDVKSS
jgi:predicted GIY-YIG superfamily endonuclease